MQDQENAAGMPENDNGAAVPTAEANDAPAVETGQGMEELLKKAERAAQENHDAWLRAKAEADNIRKRARPRSRTPTSSRSRTSRASCWR